MRSAWWKAAWSVGALLLAGCAQAEVGELKLMSPYGIGYLQLTVMKGDKLVEKHLARAGLHDTRVTWAASGSEVAAGDALVSGNLHLAAGGAGTAFLLWDRTRGNVDVRGVAALASMPSLLVSRDPRIKSLKDFTEKDRIAIARPGSSVQAVYLQMAAAKEFGQENFGKLNALVVDLAHTEGLRAMLSASAELRSQFTLPPFQNQALEHGAHVVLNSYDVMGGPTTFRMVWTTSKFRTENPKTYKALVDALSEATESINANKRHAAELHVAEGGGKENVDRIVALMNDPQVRYTVTPERVLPLALFMNQIGMLKIKPTSWKDLFFPEIHHLPGS